MLKTPMGKKGEKEFLDLEVSLFVNKNTGQYSITIPKRKIPKRQLRDFNNGSSEMPKKVPIKLFKWWGKT